MVGYALQALLYFICGSLTFVISSWVLPFTVFSGFVALMSSNSDKRVTAMALMSMLPFPTLVCIGGYLYYKTVYCIAMI